MEFRLIRLCFLTKATSANTALIGSSSSSLLPSTVRRERGGELPGARRTPSRHLPASRPSCTGPTQPGPSLSLGFCSPMSWPGFLDLKLSNSRKETMSYILEVILPTFLSLHKIRHKPSTFWDVGKRPPPWSPCPLAPLSRNKERWFLRLSCGKRRIFSLLLGPLPGLGDTDYLFSYALISYVLICSHIPSLS